MGGSWRRTRRAVLLRKGCHLSRFGRVRTACRTHSWTQYLLSCATSQLPERAATWYWRGWSPGIHLGGCLPGSARRGVAREAGPATRSARYFTDFLRGQLEGAELGPRRGQRSSPRWTCDCRKRPRKRYAPDSLSWNLNTPRSSGRMLCSRRRWWPSIPAAVRSSRWWEAETTASHSSTGP